MTAFERVGVNYQLDAQSIIEANKLFRRTCECCTSKGRHSICRQCAVKHSHDLMVAYFKDKSCMHKRK